MRSLGVDVAPAARHRALPARAANSSAANSSAAATFDAASRPVRHAYRMIDCRSIIT